MLAIIYNKSNYRVPDVEEKWSINKERREAIELLVKFVAGLKAMGYVKGVLQEVITWTALISAIGGGVYAFTQWITAQ